MIFTQPNDEQHLAKLFAESGQGRLHPAVATDLAEAAYSALSGPAMSKAEVGRRIIALMIYSFQVGVEWNKQKELQ